jgi:hypothetical protein
MGRTKISEYVKRRKKRSECVKWTGEMRSEYVKWTGEKRSECVKWTGEKRSECVKWTREKRSECVKWTGEKTSECVKWTGEKRSECVKWTGEKRSWMDHVEVGKGGGWFTGSGRLIPALGYTVTGNREKRVEEPRFTPFRSSSSPHCTEG